MRASGVDAHPAQTAALPAEIKRASATANNRLLSVSTHLECRTEQLVSTEGTSPVSHLECSNSIKGHVTVP